MKSLVTKVLSENNEDRKNISTLLNLELKDLGGVLSAILPEIELLIGKKEPLEHLPTIKETQERLFETLLKFYNCFTGENILVLVLDDLQWADAASFVFLEKLLSLKDQKIFLIGAYRDNEVGENHPLMGIIKEYKTISSINLQPLKLEHLNEMVAETLNSNESKTLKLSELIHKKTLGNPFFSREFINTLYQEELLSFKNDVWNWDVDKVEKMDFSSNVIDFMIKNLKKTPKNMQKLLNRAACIGNTFRIEELKWVWDESTSVESELLEPVKEGWIHQLNSNEYQFFHDRLQQSSFELFEKEGKKIHLIIGNILLDQFNKQNNIEKHIFSIVNHLNIAKDLFKDQKELLKLNLIATNKSLENSAFSAALKFSTISNELLPPDAWKSDYPLAFESNLVQADTYYANSNLEEADKFYTITLENSIGRMDKLNVISKYIKYLVVRNLKDKAYFLFVDAYKMFDFTKDIPFDDVNGTLEWTLNLKKKIDKEIQNIGGLKNLLKLKSCNDKELIIFMTLMSESMDVLVLAPKANPMLIITNSLVALYFYLTVGLTYTSPIGIGFTGWIYSFFFREKEGYELTSISEKFLSLDKNPIFNVVSVHNVIGVGALTGGSFKQIVFHLDTANRIAMNVGEFVFGAYASLHSSSCYSFNGENFLTLLSKMKKRQNWLNQIKNYFNVDFLEILQHFIADLAGVSNYNPKLTIENFTSYKHANCFKPTIEGILHYHKGDMEAALASFDVAEPVGDSGKGLPDYYERKFYHCLTLIHHYKKLKEEAILDRIKPLLEEYKLFSSLGPEYLGPRYKVLDSFLQCTFEKTDKMKILSTLEDLYEISNELGLSIIAAVISELILQYCDENGFPKGMCKVYYNNCQKIWSTLSAKKKEAMLKKKYSKYASTQNRKKSDTSATLISSTTLSDSDGTTEILHESIDMMSIIKASQALSVELTTSSLIVKVMGIIIENTGAQNGLLFVNGSQGEILEVSMKSGTLKKIQKSTDLIKENDMYCNFLYSLAKTMKKTIIINDIPHSQYSENPYLLREKVKSLCIHPIIKGNKHIGMIYLEHNSLEGTFDEARKEILEHISSQIAISYENAKLYEDMNSLNLSYERFLPKEFLKQLGKGDIRNVKKGDAATKKISVLFSDIRSFTDLTEKMNPEESFSFVNEILSYLAPIITKNNGFIDKFFGDCIMALFPYNVDDSVNCGFEMLKALKEYNKECRKELSPVRIGIGIHYGDCMLGTIGDDERLDATVISDTVNTASRVESLTKTLGATFVVTESILQNTNSIYKNRYIGKFLLKGKEIPMPLFHMIDEDSQVNVEKFTQGIQFFESGKFREAENIFSSLDDQTSKYLQEVSQVFGNYSFGVEWNGEIKIDKDGNLVKVEKDLICSNFIQSLNSNEERNIFENILKNGEAKELLNSWSEMKPEKVKFALENYK
jgi:class 3 adenylate cyclase/GAF domain-containing protein